MFFHFMGVFLVRSCIQWLRFYRPFPLASQNNYRIDANQELLSIGETPVSLSRGLGGADGRDGRPEEQGAEVARGALWPFLHRSVLGPPRGSVCLFQAGSRHLVPVLMETPCALLSPGPEACGLFYARECLGRCSSGSGCWRTWPGRHS